LERLRHTDRITYDAEHMRTSLRDFSKQPISKVSIVITPMWIPIINSFSASLKRHIYKITFTFLIWFEFNLLNLNGSESQRLYFPLQLT
jgi:hypothetical protein